MEFDDDKGDLVTADCSDDLNCTGRPLVVANVGKHMHDIVLEFLK